MKKTNNHITVTGKNYQNKPVTQKEIADHCGLHQTTVSQALRYDPRINKDTLDLVHKTAAEMGYDPTHQEIARRMVLRRYGRQVLHNVIGLILPKEFHKSEYFDAVFHGVMDILSPSEYDTVLISPPGDGGEEEDIFKSPTFRRTELDGMIIFGYLSTGILVKWLRESPAFNNRPIVTLIYPETGCDCVEVDYETGEYLAAQHLLKSGHRHLLHFGITGNILPKRISGINRAMNEVGIDSEIYLHQATGADFYLDPTPMPQNDVFVYYTNSSGQLVYGSIIKLLREYPLITGILAWNDPCAHHIRRTLQANGYHVPGDYSVIGFDDTHPNINEPGNVPITTLHVPLEEIGHEAARLLIYKMSNDENKILEKKIIPELILRESTARTCLNIPLAE